ncbi:unnamed protein product [Polarella glacialis]|uniref:Uncharacterized protein n=1 Tax=Polarella glacialis TaxID=89957 RepID=A0A813IAY1_POLGL|nr:unnamed protein product [Polarella glacialis]|mmetsp:Transcript_66808/g.120255  ORF Transcript_66808/g.120255 Transcript_66808/m.120255 type:complete len:259 (-) Transcript_66808:226-1002(-)
MCKAHGVTQWQAGFAAAATALVLYWRIRRWRPQIAPAEQSPSVPILYVAGSMLKECAADVGKEGARSGCPSDQVVDFESQVRMESHLLEEAAFTVRLVLKTGAYLACEHIHVAEKQLKTIADKLEELAELACPRNIFWRYGRSQPMAGLLDLPLLRLGASELVMVPVTSNYEKEPGELAIGRFLVSGTDAKMSRYLESSSGILDAVQRARLLLRLEWMFFSIWDLPLTWGDEADNVPLGTGTNPHNASAFHVASKSKD